MVQVFPPITFTSKSAHIRYQTPRPDPPSIPEGNVPICIWAPSNWIVSKKGNPVRPEHVESILGISYLVCLVLREMLMRTLGQWLNKVVYGSWKLKVKEPTRHCISWSYSLSQMNFVDIVRDVSMAIGKSFMVIEFYFAHDVVLWMLRIAANGVVMVTVSCSLLTAAHWTGVIDGQNWGWPPHQLVSGMTTVQLQPSG